MKRIIAVIFVILCLCGCDMKRIRTESSIKEYETDFSTVYAETVKFSGMKNSELEKNINAQIQQSIDSDLVAFDSKAQECKDNLQMGNKCVIILKLMCKVANTPSLRDTSPQGETFHIAPLEGSCRKRDCGVAKKERPTVAPNQSVVYIPLSYTRTNLPNQV